MKLNDIGTQQTVYKGPVRVNLLLHHIHRVSLLCEFFYVLLSLLDAQIFYYKHHVHNVSLLFVFFYVLPSDLFVQILCYTHHTHEVSLRCVHGLYFKKWLLVLRKHLVALGFNEYITKLLLEGLIFQKLLLKTSSKNVF